MWLVKLLLFIIAITVLVGFILYNSTERVILNFPWAEYYNVPLAFVCFGAFVIGMFVSFVYSIFYFLKISGETRDKNRQIKKLEIELSALRNRSLEELDEEEDKPDKEEEL